jgi:D-alanine-D-alanine ligase
MSDPVESLPRVLVLMGGPDAEREISIRSGSRVAAALRESGSFAVDERIIDGLTPGDLAEIAADVIFPVLHGPWGEGGPLQDVLEADGRPYVGSRPRASRISMDKMASKLFVRAAGVRTPPAREVRMGQPIDLPLPFVIKPIEDGSSVGVRHCVTPEDVEKARADLEGHHPRLMAESLITGREMTVGILERETLPIIEIVPAVRFYDYEAKYERSDTQYIVDPELPPGAADEMNHAARIAYERIGCRDVARIDFILNEEGAWFLEINSMPGMTDHSLVPKAAQHAGVRFPDLCARLAMRALARRNRMRQRSAVAVAALSAAGSPEGSQPADPVGTAEESFAPAAETGVESHPPETGPCGEESPS